MNDNSAVSSEWVGIDHVQFAAPVGGEAPFGNRIELVQVDGDGTN